MALNLLFIPLVYFCYPETARLTLEEMDYLFKPGDSGLSAGQKKLGRSTAVVRSLDRSGPWRRRRASMAAASGSDTDEKLGSRDVQGTDAQHVDHLA